MTVALRIEEALQASKVPTDKARQLAEALNKSIEESYVTKAELKLSHSDLLHALGTNSGDLINRISLTEANLQHSIDKLYLKSMLATGGMIVTGIGVLFGLIKTFT